MTKPKGSAAKLKSDPRPELFPSEEEDIPVAQEPVVASASPTVKETVKVPAILKTPVIQDPAIEAARILASAIDRLTDTLAEILLGSLGQKPEMGQPQPALEPVPQVAPVKPQKGSVDAENVPKQDIAPQVVPTQQAPLPEPPVQSAPQQPQAPAFHYANYTYIKDSFARFAASPGVQHTAHHASVFVDKFASLLPGAAAMGCAPASVEEICAMVVGVAREPNSVISLHPAPVGDPDTSPMVYFN